MEHILRMTEEERQLIVMALAYLSADHPGFEFSLRGIAKDMDSEKLYAEFRRLALDENDFRLNRRTQP